MQAAITPFLQGMTLPPHADQRALSDLVTVVKCTAEPQMCDQSPYSDLKMSVMGVGCLMLGEDTNSSQVRTVVIRVRNR